MRFVFVLALLSGSVSFAHALPGTQASRLVLMAERDSKLTLPPPPQGMQSDTNLLLTQRFLDLELRILELQRMPIVAPLTVTLIGGTGLVTALVFLVGAVGGGFSFIAVGLVVASVSAVPLLIGVPWLIVATNTNARIGKEMDRLKSERAQLVGPAATVPLGSF